MKTLRIDPEFRDKIPPLTEAEFKQLEENIVSDGEIREPIIVWNGTIVDGHHRWKIHLNHPEIPYKVKEMDFADKWAAVAWMVDNQLGRRNISDEQKTYLLGKLYEARKMSHGGDRKSSDFSSTKSGNLKHEEPTRVSEQIAKERGIAKNSVIRAEHFAHGLDAADAVSPGFKDKVLTGEVKAPKSAIAEIAKMPEPEKKRVVEEISAGTFKKPVDQKKAAQTREQYKLIEKIAADLKNMDKPAYNPDRIETDIYPIINRFKQELKAHLTMHSTEITAENSKKIIAALSEAETAIREMKGLVEK